MQFNRVRAGLEKVLSLPRGEQPAALDVFRNELAPHAANEAWNTDFSNDSLYDAWSSFAVMKALYQANARVLRERLNTVGPGWRLIEIGGGNGRLWPNVLGPADRGEIVLIDPVEQVHQVVASRLPEHVHLTSRVSRVQDALDLPEADGFVCSLTLHHVPGRDRSELEGHGLEGIGKLEVLQAIGKALKPRQGIGVLNEADIYCDVALPPGNEVLINNLIDSYVRRTARALLEDIAHREDADEDLKLRWLAILRLWCMDQMDMAGKPLSERDVYELDVARWLDLLHQSEFLVLSHRYTDNRCLFHQYVIRPCE